MTNTETNVPTGQLRILLVEDGRAQAEVVRRMLVGEGFEVDVATTLKDALQRGAASPCPDIVLLDLCLPDSTGKETFEKIRKELPQLAVIVLTSLADDEFGLHAVDQGAQDYLIKAEIDKRKLIRSLYYAIGRKRVLDDRMERLRLEGVLQMAGAVAHELNQPLQTVMGYAELLQRRYGDDERLGNRLELIHEQIEKIADITRKLNRVTKYETVDYLNEKIIDIHKATVEDKPDLQDSEKIYSPTK